MGDAAIDAEKHFSSSILLWVRPDLPRRVSMDRWRGPHSKIISATPGFEEYRQIHLAEKNAGLWPSVTGVETEIPQDRKIDGIAEVTLESILSPLHGRKQTKLAYADEVNLFERTILYGGLPGASRWYAVGDGDGEAVVGSRIWIFLRRRAGVGGHAFRSYVRGELVPAIAETGLVTELRSQSFMPWNEKLWDTPNVAHDNPAAVQFHASLDVGFADRAARDRFLHSDQVTALAPSLTESVSALHAYDVSETLLYITGGEVLAEPIG
ncbi:MAG: strictosidine synthase [Rhodococcus sp. (in: high G+C Gram-positive bacteria)]|uniref:strictosidine synthase n=1 Tax=Rhodococcus sp. TaxID=1831 RepID=UPI002AD606AF|nr:strictosidine synthase [Rhodococcus sp. (in: high G+C Gram-positive bacteria)]